MLEENISEEKRKAPGRPRSSAAASHEAILDAVYELLQEKSVRDLTMEEIARRAGVGKPTLYKWWPSKVAIVIDVFEERIATAFVIPEGQSTEEGIRGHVSMAIRVLNGFFGKVSAEIIAEGQSDPEVLREYIHRYLLNRRAITTTMVRKAQASGEFKRAIDPELFVDMVYGPIYYRLLVKHQPLDQQFGTQLVDHMMAYLKS
jgi:AcrR family transcriptional regulator